MNIAGLGIVDFEVLVGTVAICVGLEFLVEI